MKRIIRILMMICLLFSLAIAVQAELLAFELSWWTIDGGGGESQGGSYVLNATIGQADAGTLREESYSLAGGFWSTGPSAPIVVEYRIVLPLVIR